MGRTYVSTADGKLVEVFRPYKSGGKSGSWIITLPPEWVEMLPKDSEGRPYGVFEVDDNNRISLGAPDLPIVG